MTAILWGWGKTGSNYRCSSNTVVHWYLVDVCYCCLQSFSRWSTKQWTEQWTLCSLTPQMPKDEYPLCCSFSPARCPVVSNSRQTQIYIARWGWRQENFRGDGNGYRGWNYRDGVAKLMVMRWGWGQFTVSLFNSASSLDAFQLKMEGKNEQCSQHYWSLVLPLDKLSL